MSEKETGNLVQAVAELIVNYITQRGGLARSLPAGAGEDRSGPVAVMGAAVEEQPADE
jgi:hypothetical protein